MLVVFHQVVQDVKQIVVRQLDIMVPDQLSCPVHDEMRHVLLLLVGHSVEIVQVLNDIFVACKRTSARPIDDEVVDLL